MADATIASSAAIMKVRYADGVPKLNFRKFRFFSALKKRKDFKGESKTFAVHHEDPQGASSSFTDMITVLNPSTQSKFTVKPVNFYTAARIRGDALKRVADEGALVNLLTTETDGCTQTHIKCLEIYSLGNGTGVLGTIDGVSNVASTAVTLANPYDSAKFDLGASYSLVSSATSLSPTLRSSGAAAKVTKIDRTAGTLTFGSNLSTQIAAAVNTDSFIRVGTAAVGGIPTVHTGMQLWVAGSSPADLWGCVRSNDDVRLAGQVWDATGVGMEDALVEAEARLDVQEQLKGDLVAWVHPADLKELKRSQFGKVVWDKCSVKSSVIGLSFEGIVINGMMGQIKILSNPFQPKGEVLMCDMGQLAFESADTTPHLQDYDGLSRIRLTSDDVLQFSFASYGQLFNYSPASCIRITNWGAQ